MQIKQNIPKSNMWHHCLFLLFLTQGFTRPADTENYVEHQNCTIKNVEAQKGRKLKLVSNVVSLESCYWVFEDECCYDDKKYGGCEGFDKSESPDVKNVRKADNSICLKDNEYNVEIDSDYN